MVGLKSVTSALDPIKIKFLTPLWTGGIEGMNRVQETSIIGSLRWWYESIIRGSGHHVCNTTKEPCNAKNPCPVCKLFGCTGSKRKFSLSITSNGNIQNSKTINIRPYKRKRGWFLPGGFTGNATLTLYSTENIDHIISLMHWLSQWGAIGAKSQLGYGTFKITSHSINPSFKSLDLGTQPPGHLPDLRAFTFFKFQFVPLNTDWWKTIRDFQYTMRDKESSNILENLAANNMVPVSPLLKNYFRFRKNWKSYTTVRWLFGSIGRYTQKSKVSFSWAYKTQDCWEIRGWAWLPYDKRYIHEARNTLSNSISNESEWLKALDLHGKVSKAKIYIEPRENAWRTKDSITIQKWLTGGTL